MRINRQAKYRIAKEVVMALGVAELILGFYIAIKFGENEVRCALRWLAVLIATSYGSSRLWVWYLEYLTRGNRKDV